MADNLTELEKALKELQAQIAEIHINFEAPENIKKQILDNLAVQENLLREKIEEKIESIKSTAQ